MENFTTVLLSLSPVHILIVVAVLLIFFGGKKIPELMKGFGSGIKEFKNAVKDENDDKKDPSTQTKQEETPKTN